MTGVQLRPLLMEVVMATIHALLADGDFSTLNLGRAFEALGYHVRPVVTPDREGWALEPDLPGTLTRLAHLPGAPGFAVLLLNAAAPFEEAPGPWLQRWAGRLWRRNRTFRGLLLLTDPRQTQAWVGLLYPEGDADTPGVHLLHLRPGQPLELELERLERARPLPGEGPEALTARLRDELDLARVTRRFFLRFQRCHQRIAEGLTGWSGGAADEAAQRHVALLTLNRLIFLYFLQKKHLLDGRPAFLREQVRAWRAQRPDPERTFYRAVLRPLFFSALNRPSADRPPEALALGALPYLNGGLFEPSTVERRHPSLDLPDDALLPAFEHLLERFAFTTRDDGAGVGIDPEALGRVFEALMASEERAATGAFYTPRPLVEEVFSAALHRQLCAAGAPEGLADALLAPDTPLPHLPAHLGETLLEHLRCLSVLDPACGSGAFLLGALHRLEETILRLQRALGQPTTPRAALRRRLVTRNLCGVDLQPTAVHLCTLRLWLAILDVEPANTDLAPLPNLDHRIRCGDALLSPLDLADPPPDWRAWHAAVEELDDLKQRYASASGPDKAPLRSLVTAAEEDLLERLLNRRLEALGRRQSDLEAALHAPPLFPDLPPQATPALRKELAALRQERLRLRRLLDDPAASAFNPDLHFPEVLRDGGFHIVVGNPPWVRLEGIPHATREQLRRRYQVLHNPAWTAGGLLDSLRGAGSRVDLAACFAERSLQLLRPGGTFALVLPSKLTRALYGAAFRRLILQRTRLHEVRELDPHHFPDARAYPCALIASREAAPSPPACIRPLDPDDLGAPWIQLAEDAPDLGGHEPLAAHERLHPARGVMTGYNEAFIREARPDATRWAAALLRGADLSAFSYRVSHHLLTPHDPASLAPLPSLPPELLRELRPYQSRLQRRADLNPGDPWWRLFRLNPQLNGPRVAWRDIGLRLEAVALPARADQGRLLLPLNTVYYIPTPSLEAATLLATWLNSTPVRQLAAAIAEPAADGYHRFFSWVISVLPLPTPLADALLGHPLPPVLRRLLLLGQHLHLHPERADALQPTLDALVLALYAQRPTLDARRSA